jgi:transcriptional regulator with XRE-family HTH domain
MPARIRASLAERKPERGRAAAQPSIAVRPEDLGCAGDCDGGFAPLLRALREHACLTQEELAERSGLSIRAISDLERGRTSKPHRKSVALLAEALRIEGESREKFRRIARYKVGSSRLRAVPPLAVAGTAAQVEPADDTTPRESLSRLIEWMRQLLVDEPAGQGGEAGPGPRTPRLVELVGAPESCHAVAIEAAARFRRYFPDGHLYVNAETGVPDRAELVGRLSRMLDVEPGRLLPTLRSRRALLVLDNVVDAAQVRPFLMAGGACALIVIAQRRLALFDGVWTIDVPQLDRAGPAHLRSTLLAG